MANWLIRAARFPSQPGRRRPPRITPPRGISLLEVLISMFVLLVGLLGVAILIPVGRKEMVTAGNSDRASAVAVAALHDIKVRGILNPSGWATAQVPATPYVPAQGESFVIDPLGINLGVGTPQSFGALFPYLTSPMAIARVTLGQTAGGFNPQLRLNMADEVFRAQDELVFDLPTGDVQPPFQKFFVDTSNNNLKRLSQGSYSWLLTLVPTANPAVATVSVVVFFQRVLVTPGAGEHVLGVAGFNGGGEVTLKANTQAELDVVKTGAWLMLAAVPPTPASGPTPPRAYRWYQVVATEDQGHPYTGTPSYAGSPPFIRQATLAGSDWPYPSTDVDGSSVPNQQAWVFDGVVGVYERSLHQDVP